MYATSLISRFLQNSNQVQYGVAKRILKYLQGTKDYGIWFQFMLDSILLRYTDRDWAGSVDDIKSTSGYAFTFGPRIFSLSSKK